MKNYFTGSERLQIFEATGTPMRMAEIAQLEIPDYEVLRNFVKNHQWEKAEEYLASFHGQNMFMNSVYFGWVLIISDYYAELTSKENRDKVWPKVLKDYNELVDGITVHYHTSSEMAVAESMKKLFNDKNIRPESVDVLFSEMEKDYQNLVSLLKEKNIDKALSGITKFHRHAVVRHDSLSGYVYSIPSTIVSIDGEKTAVELSNGSVLRNDKWLALWELSKVLSTEDLAAFLAEHLRFHLSGPEREGQTQIIEDDKKIRLIFDPCGSGGAIRRRLGDKIVNLEEKHQLAWNKCGEVNLYCSHCALNEKHSIDLFGYPKLVVEFDPDPSKPCGWTVYKNQDDIPEEVYTRLGLKKSVNKP